MAYLILLTFILAPAYIIRFNFLHFPTNALMLWIFLVWMIFLSWLVIKKYFLHYLLWRRSLNKKLLVFISLFLLSGIIGLFVNGIDRAKLGQFIVLFLQPISLFFISGYIITKFPNTKYQILNTIYFLLALAGIYAVVQYFTLLGLPASWWGNSVEPKRAISFFVHPNFYALWSAPLLALLIPDLSESLKNKKYLLKISLWLLGAIGLFLSLSRAGWLGLAIATVIYLIVAADAKIRKLSYGAIIVIILVIVSVPNLRFRLLLPFVGEKSTVSRFSLWETGIKGIKENPVLGIGLNGFSNQWETLNTDKGLAETHNFPHNIFLDFWVETGLLGLISFVGVIWIGLYQGFKNKQDVIKLGVALFLLALVIQGQIDNPYFKNDLAMVFWIILALI